MVGLASLQLDAIQHISLRLSLLKRIFFKAWGTGRALKQVTSRQLLHLDRRPPEHV